jgi:uncharacterized protein (TIGR02996 family)
MSLVFLNSDTLSGLLLVAQEEHDEDTSRLILADYLDEYGDPRGEMVRLSTQFAHHKRGDAEWYDLHDRLREWRRDHQADWLGRSPNVHVHLERGLVALDITGTQLTSTSFARKLQAALDAGWVRKLTLTGGDDGSLIEAIQFGQVERVTALALKYGSPGKPAMHSLGALGHLRELALAWGNRLPDAGMHYLLDLPQLQSLHLDHWSQLTTDDFLPLAQCGRLRELSLIRCDLLDENRFGFFASLPELRVLHLADPAMTGAGLVHLASLSRLRELILSEGTHLHARSLESLGPLQELERLTVSCGEHLGRVPLSVLPVLPRLEMLALPLPAFEVSTLPVLEQYPALRGLKLRAGATLNDDSGEPLGRLTELQRLQIRGSAISDAGLAWLARLTRLRSLDLTDSHYLNGRHFDLLASMPELRRLVLCNCTTLAGEALDILGTMTQLRELDLTHCWRLREKDVERLQKALPRCRIER